MENIITLTSGEKIEVLMQDEVGLDIDCSLRYIESGKKEIENYVDEVLKLQLNNIVIDAKEEMETQISSTIEDVKQQVSEALKESINDAASQATAIVADYSENKVKPQLNELVSCVEESVGQAANSSVEASVSATDSRNNAEDARIWAEGNDNEVQAIDGEHSSKGWATLAKQSETNAKSYADSINPATLVNIGSDQTIDGRKTLTKPITARMNTVEENTPPAQNQFIDWITPVDKNGLGIGYLGVADYADGRRGSRIGHTRTKSDGSKVYASIDVGTDANGNIYTAAPTPASTDSSTKIATTSWVNNAGAVVKSKTLAANGYIKFSSGLIIQWGLALNGNVTTFPTPFTSATSYAITTGYCGAGSTDKMWGQIHDRKNTSFDWVAADSSEEMCWIAIGY